MHSLTARAGDRCAMPRASKPVDPAPTPSMARPPLSSCSVAVAVAVSAGGGADVGRGDADADRDARRDGGNRAKLHPGVAQELLVGDPQPVQVLVAIELARPAQHVTRIAVAEEPDSELH